MKKYSGKAINRAGENFLDNAIFDDKDRASQSLEVLAYWRSLHSSPLESAFENIKKIVIKYDSDAIFAKRLKRYISIIKKLRRFTSMKLKNMQDIGGCRVVLKNEQCLRNIVKELKKLPEYKTGSSQTFKYKDYIKNPKSDGYRSFHVISNYSDENGEIKNIELQLRTYIQHYWATALEIVDLFTDQALKSNHGDANWKGFFANVSYQFAMMDAIDGFDNLSESQKLNSYIECLKGNGKAQFSCSVVQTYCNSLNVYKLLEGFAGSLSSIDDNEIEAADYILIQVETNIRKVKCYLFSKDKVEDANEKYLELEKETVGKPDKVVALVSASSLGGIKEAYPNFFADSSQFIEHLDLVMSVNFESPPQYQFG